MISFELSAHREIMAKMSTKIAITLEARPKGTSPFGVFHTSSRSIYRQKIGPKGIYHFGYFPRQLSLQAISLMCSRDQFWVLVGGFAFPTFLLLHFTDEAHMIDEMLHFRVWIKCTHDSDYRVSNSSELFSGTVHAKDRWRHVLIDASSWLRR
jgi:hypothetical protein